MSLDLLLQNLPGAAYRCRNDLCWTMEFISEGVQALTGYSAAAFTQRPGLPYAEIIVPEDRARVAEAIALALSEGGAYQITYRIRTASGELRWIWEQGALDPSSGAPGMLEGFLSDLTRLKQADTLILEQASFLEHARDAIVAMDMNGRIKYWNQGATRLYGWSAAQVLDQYFCDLLCDAPGACHAAFAATCAIGEWSGELMQARSDGSCVSTETRWTLLEPDRALGACQKVLLIATDISERKHSEAHIFRLAFFDQLTDLPNRASLLDHLRRALLGSARTQKCGALMFCDLDNFKCLNDSQGHAAGDMLLQAVARRLEHCVRESDMVARLGGDEFVILIPPLEESRAAAASQAETVAAKVINAMSTPFQLAELSYHLSVSVGVTTLCGTSDTVESTLRQADVAMYQAKAAGGAAFRFYE